jgi:hypothetical protein
MGWKDWAVPLMPPGHLHTSLRSLLHKGLSPKVIRDEKEYDPIIQRAIQSTLLEKLKGFEGNPADIVGRQVDTLGTLECDTNPTISRTISDIIIDITYGDALKTSTERDRLVEANKEAIDATSRAFTTFWAVDYLPFRETSTRLRD